MKRAPELDAKDRALLLATAGLRRARNELAHALAQVDETIETVHRALRPGVVKCTPDKGETKA